MKQSRHFGFLAALAISGCATAPTPAPEGPPPASAAVAADRKPALDESQPGYWAAKLDDPTSGVEALRRLNEMFENAVVEAAYVRDAPNVRSFVDETVEPLTRLYVERYAELDARTRVRTIKLLADYRDPRTEPALRKAFEAFAENPMTERDETDIKWASQAQAALRLENLSQPLFAAFSKLRVSSMLGGVAYRDVYQAMKQQPRDPTWVGPLIAKLEPKMAPVDAKNRRSFDDARDQIFWQTTAAEVLGQIGDPAAVEPLFQVVLDPAKQDLSYAAGLSLVRLGRASTAIGIRLLNGGHETLRRFYLERTAELGANQPHGRPWVGVAARVLGACGRREAVAPLIAVVRARKDDDQLVTLLEALTRIPGAPEAKDVVKKAYRRLPVRSLPVFTQALARFLDPELVPWMLATAGSMNGTPAEREATQNALLEAALRLASPSQLGDVKAAAEKLRAKEIEASIRKVEPVVATCQKEARCYLEALTKPEHQTASNQIVGVKAGYAFAMVAGDQDRDALIARLREIPNPALRFVAALALDHGAPRGSRAVAEKLRTIIEENAKHPDPDKAAGDLPLKEAMFRLQARVD